MSPPHDEEETSPMMSSSELELSQTEKEEDEENRKRMETLQSSAQSSFPASIATTSSLLGAPSSATSRYGLPQSVETSPNIPTPPTRSSNPLSHDISSLHNPTSASTVNHLKITPSAASSRYGGSNKTTDFKY